MNANNLENEKLLANEEAKADESTNAHPVEEIKSGVSEEVAPEEPVIEEEVQTPESEETQVESEKPEEEPKTETEEESTTEEIKEIDYEIETPEQPEEASETEEEVDENNVSDDDSVELLSVEEIVQKLRDLLASEHPQRKEVDEVKNQFYRSLRNETETQKAAFLETGGESIDFVANESAIYIEGKELIQKIKEKRTEIIAREDAEKEKNVAKKMAIIEQVKHLAESQSQEDFNKTYQEFRALQQQWSEIKLVPQTKVNELWKEYQRHVEKFYDLVRINNEFRE